MRNLLTLLSVILISNLAHAYGSGSQATWSLGAFGGIATTNQSDLNTLITRANTRVGGISTPQFGNAWEFGGYIERRLNASIVALQIRPSYMTNSANGTGSGGSYNYSVSGFAIAPLIRLYILESSGIKLYVEGGINWGSLTGKIQEAGATTTFSGSNFGYQGGIGVDFCFGARSQHCIWGNGGARYLSIDRNIASDASGTFSSGANASLSQAGKGLETEIDGHDLATTMSGFIALLGYKYNL